jgi:glucokinase
LTRLLGIDVGGTKCHGVCVDPSGELIAEKVLPTPSAGELVELLARLVDELGGGESVGVGVPGLIGRDGVIHSSPNLSGARRLAVAEPLRQVLGVEVAVENDATCALVAEVRLGRLRGVRDAWLVTLGTGIGGALLADGEVRRGSQGFAGEVGHMRVVPDGLTCPCGRGGCWERYASGAALGEMAGARSTHEVIAAARAGDRAAAALMATWVDWIGVGVAALANATDPEVIVIGGGLIEEHDLFLDDVAVALRHHLYAADERRVPTIRATSFGHRSGAIGAALLGHD